MPSRRTPRVNIPKRIEKWKSENADKKLTAKVNACTSELTDLIEMILPESIVKETLEKSFSAASVLFDTAPIFEEYKVKDFEGAKKVKLDVADQMASRVAGRSVGEAVKIVSLEKAGVLGVAEVLKELFTLSYLTVFKVSAAFGFDPMTGSDKGQELCHRLFEAGLSLSQKDKHTGIERFHQSYETNVVSFSKDERAGLCEDSVKRITSLLGKRRSLSSVEGFALSHEGGFNAWIVSDLTQAAIHLFAEKRVRLYQQGLQQAAALKAQNAQAATPNTPSPLKKVA